MFEDKRTFFALLSSFFLLETFLSFWTGHPYDMGVWFNTGVWMNRGVNIYLPPNHIGYPPLWALWCAVANILYTFLGSNYEVWRFILKFPLIIAHLGLAFIVGKFAESRFGPKTARRIFLIILGWSFFIYVSAIWGQINALSALLTFLAFYALIERRTKTSAFLLGLAITLKIYPVVTLPAFLIYVLKNGSKKEAARFAVLTWAVPILFTLSVFALFQWDIVYFFKTIFYSTPVFESDPLQFNVGCMNIWSFVALLGIDIVPLWQLRQLWIPILALVAFFWLRKTKFGEKDFALSVVSFYILFMISYGWIAEQTFIDLLPFAFLLTLGYNSKRAHFYLLILIQAFVFVFSFANQSLAVFAPLAQLLSPTILTTSERILLDNGPIIWTIRGTMGLVVSGSLAVFLTFLVKPEILEHLQNSLRRFLNFIGRKDRSSTNGAVHDLASRDVRPSLDLCDESFHEGC